MLECDLVIVGGGIAGAGIARDACGRGLKVILLEKDDIGAATSSSSTKLLHGGLRYLENYDFSMVRKSLIEREILLKNMPHIARPLRFLLPYKKGLRPFWLLRLGLFLYDNLYFGSLLPNSKTVRFNEHSPLVEKYTKGFEYSDCWVEDTRMVILNARDVVSKGGTILPRCKCLEAVANSGEWFLTAEDQLSGAKYKIKAKVLVNACGPWGGKFLSSIDTNYQNSSYDDKLRLVRGSHIVVPRLYDHDKAYILQNDDDRIIFTIPYEDKFTLIGTTEVDHQGSLVNPECSQDEQNYLCEAVSKYFKKRVTPSQVVWKYSGIRPLIEDRDKSAHNISRDYQIERRDFSQSVVFSIFGTKITSHRIMAQEFVDNLADLFDNLGPAWTEGKALPGGDFDYKDRDQLIDKFMLDFPFFDTSEVKRLIRDYGTDAWNIFAGSKTRNDIGKYFGAGLSELELKWAMDKEFVMQGRDFYWGRNRQGLLLTKEQRKSIDSFVCNNLLDRRIEF